MLYPINLSVLPGPPFAFLALEATISDVNFTGPHILVVNSGMAS